MVGDVISDVWFTDSYAKTIYNDECKFDDSEQHSIIPNGSRVSLSTRSDQKFRIIDNRCVDFRASAVSTHVVTDDTVHAGVRVEINYLLASLGLE